MRCAVCPRRCGADRAAGEIGYCGAGAEIRVAKVMLHPWEEPCLGTPSGAIFFTGCPLRCIYCQNGAVSRCEIQGEIYSVPRLAEEMLSLQARGAANIDLVSPTQYTAEIREALRLCRDRLTVPVVWNTGGYELPASVRSLSGLVDIFLTDFKYGTKDPASAYSDAPDYPETAAEALAAMYETVGDPLWQGDRLTRGIILRHLVLPGGRRDSAEALRRAALAVPPAGVVLSLMRQYTPDFAPPGHKPLSRRVTTYEYEYVRDAALELGYEGYGQEADAARAAFTPTWGEAPQ